MNVTEIRAELEKRRVDVGTPSCDCCSGSVECGPDPDGAYVRWPDIEDVLAYIEREQA